MEFTLAYFSIRGGKMAARHKGHKIDSLQIDSQNPIIAYLLFTFLLVDCSSLSLSPLSLNLISWSHVTHLTLSKIFIFCTVGLLCHVCVNNVIMICIQTSLRSAPPPPSFNLIICKPSVFRKNNLHYFSFHSSVSLLGLQCFMFMISKV